jgi:hypothetical protein
LSNGLPLAIHAAQKLRCTTEDENRVILILRLGEEGR